MCRARNRTSRLLAGTERASSKTIYIYIPCREAGGAKRSISGLFDSAVNSKRDSHDAFAQQRGAAFVPLVMEANGCWSKCVQKNLDNVILRWKRVWLRWRQRSAGVVVSQYVFGEWLRLLSSRWGTIWASGWLLTWTNKVQFNTICQLANKKALTKSVH